MLPRVVAASTDRLTVAAVRCAWAQWASIGVHTARVPQTDDEIVDVEALLLASLGLAGREPRLASVAADWVLTNPELVSIARVRALIDGEYAGLTPGIGELAHRVVAEGKDARWTVLANGKPPLKQRKASTRTRASNAVLPRWRGARTLQLQLRRGFGVSVKADVLAILFGITGTWTDVSALAELSGYTVAAIRRAADDMADARLISTTGGHGRGYRVSLDAWTKLLPDVRHPVWRRRSAGYAFVLRWLHTLESKKATHNTELSYSIAFSSLMLQSWRLWNDAGVTEEPASDRADDTWSSRDAAIKRFILWFEDRAMYGDEYEIRRDG